MSLLEQGQDTSDASLVSLGPLGRLIETKLREALSPVHLEVINESYKHKVPKGSETHFKVVVVTPRFEGLSSIKRHQLVYGVLITEMTNKPGIHALAITSRTPAEWEVDPSANASPKCAGGNLL